VHSRSFVVCLCLLVLAAACENSTDPFIGIGGNGGSAITPAQATGNWSFRVQRTTNLPCSAALANGQVIAVHLDVLSDGSVNSTTSSWQNPISGAVQPITGTVGLSNGALNLTFAAPAVGNGAAMELAPATMTPGGAVTGGTLTDPAAGFSQVFGSDGCQYSTTATKTG
jgi:hypothetical protein